MEKTFQIYYTSDTHGHIFPIDYAANCSQNSGLLNMAVQIEKDGNTLVLDGGDSLQGTPLTQYYLENQEQWPVHPVAAAFNAMGLDYFTLGNHDFNFGYQDALKRKAEIESKKTAGTFLPPSDQTIKEFMLDFVSLYGEKRWGVSMFDSQTALIANYINPIIGDMKVQDITPRVVDKYIQTLQKTPPVATKTHRPKSEYMSNQNIEKIIKLLRCAFKQAVRWELVATNPFDNYILRQWKASQNELKELLGDKYQDYDLVVAMPNGRPCEERIIAGEFQKLRESAGLPKVVFHSLRHSSTTYKLKLNHGDLKATQGDTGHAQIDMITQVYAHILDEDRKVNAQKFEDAFYANANPDLRTVRPPEPPKPKEPEKPAATPSLDLAGLVAQLQKSPELVSTLAALLSAVPSEKSF